MSSANDPAFPEVKTNWPNASRHDTYSIGGLTKREYFAAMAMRGLCSRNIPLRDIEDASVMIADALLDKLERTK